MRTPAFPLFVPFLAVLGLTACGSSEDTTATSGAGGALTGCSTTVAPSDDDTHTVQDALIAAETGDTVCFSKGTYHFTDELSLATKGVTLKGEPGAVLDFSGQKSGGNGLAITGDDDVVESLRIENPKGDGIRATEVDGIAFKKVEVVWTAGGKTTNGGYGLYPVQSQRVLIEDCLVSGASDAGIYVGQSKQIVVRRNEVTQNVAGIEIENSTEADVYENHAHDNVGGILVFALPGLPSKDSATARIHDNVIENNNVDNFAPEGNIVALVPGGTGVFVMASDRNEIDHNTIRGNVSLGTAIIAWDTAGKEANDPEYDHYPEGNFIHDNVFEKNGTAPKARAALIASALLGVKKVPEMVWDGTTDAMKDNADGALTNCYDANGDADFANFDYANTGKNKSFDLAPYTCKHPPLPSVDASGFPGGS
jgi:parallel beta-helix repeat protein